MHWNHLFYGKFYKIQKLHFPTATTTTRKNYFFLPPPPPPPLSHPLSLSLSSSFRLGYTSIIYQHKVTWKRTASKNCHKHTQSCLTCLGYYNNHAIMYIIQLIDYSITKHTPWRNICGLSRHFGWQGNPSYSCRASETDSLGSHQNMTTKCVHRIIATTEIIQCYRVNIDNHIMSIMNVYLQNPRH